MKKRNLLLAMTLILSLPLAKAEEPRQSTANTSMQQTTETNTSPDDKLGFSKTSREKTQTDIKNEAKKVVNQKKSAKAQADQLAAKKKAQEDAKVLQDAVLEINDSTAHKPSAADMGGGAQHK